MIKIVIVDDEALVRLGMKSMIEWESNGFEVVGDAEDGKQALSIIERQLPDIVLTDIVMPEMDGLELIRELRRKYPLIRIIVLSSHHDFEYVRKAMKLGADDYVLKASLKPADFLKVMQETAERVHANKTDVEAVMRPAEQREAARLAIFQLLAGNVLADEDRKWLIEWLEWPIQQKRRIYFIRVHQPKNTANYKVVERTLCHVLEQQLAEDRASEVFLYKAWELFLLVRDSDGSAEDESVMLADMLIAAVRRYVNLSISIGISPAVDDPERLASAFRQSRDAVKIGFYEGIGRSYRFMEDYFQKGTYELTQKEKQAIADHVQLCNEAGLLALSNQICEETERRKVSVDQVKAACLDFLYELKTVSEQEGLEWGEWTFFQRQPFYVFVLDIESLKVLREWLAQFMRVLIERLRKLRDTTYRDEIRKLIDYMYQNHMYNLSLGDAARIVSMSESYLSFVFKKETGKSFIEYLTDLRIARAAEYLKTTDMPSYMIAERVGYDNINYFGRIFKKVTGLSPRQYRDKYRG